MKAEEYKIEGNKYFSQGHYPEAIKSYTKAIECQENYIYYSNRSACYSAVGNYQKAIEDADKCISLNSSWTKGYYRKAIALSCLEKYAEALSVLKQGQILDPHDISLNQKIEDITIKMSTTPAGAEKLKGNDFYRQGLFPNAIDCYSRALNLITSQTSQTAETAEKSKTLEKEKIDCLNNRASCHYQIRSFSHCITDSSEVLDIDPNNIKALLRRGLSYESLEKFELALTDLKKIQELSPGLPQVTTAITRISKMVKMKEGCSW